MGLFNLLLLFSTKTSLDQNMSNIDEYLYVLTIIIVATMVLRFVLNMLLCRSITEKDPFNQVGKNRNQKTIIIMNGKKT